VQKITEGQFRILKWFDLNPKSHWLQAEHLIKGGQRILVMRALARKGFLYAFQVKGYPHWVHRCTPEGRRAMRAYERAQLINV